MPSSVRGIGFGPPPVLLPRCLVSRRWKSGPFLVTLRPPHPARPFPSFPSFHSFPLTFPSSLKCVISALRFKRCTKRSSRDFEFSSSASASACLFPPSVHNLARCLAPVAGGSVLDIEANNSFQSSEETCCQQPQILALPFVFGQHSVCHSISETARTWTIFERCNGVPSTPPVQRSFCQPLSPAARFRLSINPPWTPTSHPSTLDDAAEVFPS